VHNTCALETIESGKQTVIDLILVDGAAIRDTFWLSLSYFFYFFVGCAYSTGSSTYTAGLD
jgi:hypothetical protein